MKRKTIMGSLLNTFRYERQRAREAAQADLWKRNKLVNPTKRDGFKIEEDVRVGKDGHETTYYALWKRVDEIAIDVSIDVKSEVMKLKDEGEDW